MIARKMGALIFAQVAALAFAQKIGTHVVEEHPGMSTWSCDASGSCAEEKASVVLDSNWRWVHDGQYTNCYKDGDWNKQLCPDPITCAQNCHLDGVGLQQYTDTYGVSTSGDKVKLDFIKKTEYGTNYGSRVYLLDDESTYKVFKPLNRDFTLTVDVSHLPCGLNGAVYFVEMDADGGVTRSNGLNQAGAKYGTGYCDAQCPHDMKFINGQANSVNWNATSDPPVGAHGVCCSEMDIWEANSRATAYTPHPCNTQGPLPCQGVDCGDNTADQRYDGVCDKDGCDFNNWRLGEHSFFGRGSNFAIDTTKKVTVVTQFITSDGTDTGDLVDIRRFYVQEGKLVPNSNSSIAGVVGNSVTDGLCDSMKSAFGDINDFKRKGGLKVMGEALKRGVVLVMSLWDDPLANMLWLDSSYPTTSDASTPGVLRGPCKTTSGTPEYVRSKYPTASVEYSQIQVGPLGSTFGAVPSAGAGSGDPFGGDRRLSLAGVFV